MMTTSNYTMSKPTTIRIFQSIVAALLLFLSSIPAFSQGESGSSSVDSSRATSAPLDGTVQVRSGRVQTNSSFEVAPPAPPSLKTVTGSGLGGSMAPGFASPRMMSASALGATIGGAKDIGYARRLIEQGHVPNFIDFSPEGLYSEHDIPTPSGECDAKLCLSLGYGFAPAADDRTNALFLQLGMNSNIKADQFRRPNLQLALVIDRSGSMEGESMEATKKALHKLVANLTADDELTIIQFDDNAQVIWPAARVGNKEALNKLIDGITPDGGTDIELGLRLGFAQLAALPAREGASKRLFLFTDAMPNAGRTDSASFRTLTQKYAAEGIGLTAFGVGVDFGHELVYHISQLRGGNFFYLETPEKVAKVFDTEFDYLVTPLVYDLNVTIKTPRGLKLKAVYGLPTWKPGDRDANLHVPTVFLSSNRGAIVLRYERESNGTLGFSNGDLIASGTLGFTDVNGKEYKEEQEVRYNGQAKLEPGAQYFTHDGIKLATALTNIYFGLRDGCTLFAEGKREEAAEAVTRAKTLAALQNAQLMDEGLTKEIKLLEKLAENISKKDAEVHRKQSNEKQAPRSR
ncbi:MAG: VWA domain-containing protein [Armatimonadetes bacterium]|nr:VWA domain-containing protein [Armatimonadota bacterium]